MFRTVKFLAYSSIMPFFGLTVLMLFQSQIQHIFAFLYLIYGGFMTSFFAGSHWKQAIINKDYSLQYLCLMPTILAVFILLLGMVFNPVWMLPMLMVLFVWLYRLDERLSGNVGREYLIIRRNVTVLICTLIIISFAVSYDF